MPLNSVRVMLQTVPQKPKGKMPKRIQSLIQLFIPGKTTKERGKIVTCKTSNCESYICSICKQRNMIVGDLFIILWSTSLLTPPVSRMPAQHTVSHFLLLIQVFRRVVKITGTIISITIFYTFTTNSRTSYNKSNNTAHQHLKSD